MQLISKRDLKMTVCLGFVCKRLRIDKKYTYLHKWTLKAVSTLLFLN